MPATATIDLLRELVGFDTTSHRSNLDLIAWVEDHLAEHGVVSRRVPSPDGRKAGLIARIGPVADGGVLLCGHTDTVPAEGQGWSGDPFTLRTSGDRVIGRGTVDMKGFIAAVLAAVPHLVEADLQSPAYIGLTYDEELGCLGAAPFAKALFEEPVLPAWGIVGEPTDMAVVQAHKGVWVMRTVVTGTAAHSSQPDQGASAITAAARIVSRIEDVAAGLRTAVVGDSFDPPFTTMNVGTINGGTALNIIPSACELVWEFRFSPGEDPEAVLSAVVDHHGEVTDPTPRQVHPGITIATDVIAAVAPLDAGANADAAEVLAAAAGVPRRLSVSYGTDGGVLQQAGVPCVVFGPGEPTQMHQPDESIAVEDLAAFDTALRRVVDPLCR